MTAHTVVSRTLGPAVAILSLLAVPAFAASGQPPARFQLSGSGTLSEPAAVTQAGANLHLRATLSPVRSAPVAQTASGYMLSGKLAQVPLVCYADTIFRDGFQTYY